MGTGYGAAAHYGVVTAGVQVVAGADGDNVVVREGPGLAIASKQRVYCLGVSVQNRHPLRVFPDASCEIQAQNSTAAGGFASKFVVLEYQD